MISIHHQGEWVFQLLASGAAGGPDSLVVGDLCVYKPQQSS